MKGVIQCLVAAVLATTVLCSCRAAEQLPVPQDLERATVLYVVDGDTLCVQPDDVEGPQKVRLIGVDTPESVASQDYLDATGKENTPAGEEASAYTKSLVHEGQTVWLTKDVSDTDRYGRLLRYVWLDEPEDPESEDEVEEKTLNALLIAAGYAKAVAYEPDVKFSKLFEDLEKK